MSLDKPTLVYDGDCGFCLYWIARWRHRTGGRVDFIPYQEPDSRLKRVPKAQLEESIHLFEPDGRITKGAEAVFRALSLGAGPLARLPLALYLKLPGFALVTEFVYRLVARNRTFFSFWSRLLYGSSYEPPSFHLTRWLFLRGLGIIYLIAFISLWTQISGLVGKEGILPAKSFLDAVRGQFGYEGFIYLPTLCWIESGDGFLHFLCGSGVVLSLLVIAGLAPAPVLAVLWAFYLSLVAVGQDFLSFQWDILLLETGFLAIFFAPLQVLPNIQREGPSSRLVVWLLRLLLFKLMFLSGLVKLTSQDPTWANLTALQLHYETQPLPTVFGWFAHQLPAWFHKFSALAMFAIELGAPFLIFGPRRVRYLACGLLIFLQVLIFLTGNYCFFNLLSLLLCLILLDDTVLPKAWRKTIAEKLSKWKFGSKKTPSRGWPRPVLIPLAVLWIFMSTIALTRGFRARIEWPWIVEKTYALISPYHTINGYGLFSIMTTSRPEIIVEGSRDGVEWYPYEFKHKAGDIKRAPGWVQPHQPRLDWQMWFAALGGPERSAWFFQFCGRLLQGSPEVLELVEKNPFPEKPPRYIRAVIYDYHFTDFGTLKEKGEWWRREPKGYYCPPLTLIGDRIMPIQQ